MNKLILSYYSTFFNVFNEEPLPLVFWSPSLELSINPEACPIAIHRAAPVPIRFQVEEQKGQIRDIKLGVLKKDHIYDHVT